jgi:hypothetical protein
MPEITSLQTEMALSPVSWQGRRLLNLTEGHFDVR